MGKLFTLSRLLSSCSLALACLHDDATIATLRRGGPGPKRRSSSVIPEGTIRLDNARVFNGEDFSDPTSVYLQGGHITSDGSNVSQTVDCNEGYLIPGLIDSHTHVSSVADLETFSSYGVTTVFSMNCMNYTSCRSLQEQGPGLTQFFTSGLITTSPGSLHSRTFSIPTDEQIVSPSQAPEFVEWTFGNESDYFKIIAEYNGPSQAIQNALVSQSRLRGRRSMTHATQLFWYDMAIASHTDGLQHVPGDANLSSASIDKILAQDQFVTPTLSIFRRITTEPALEQIIIGANNTNETFAGAVRNARLLHQAGVPLLAGTDSIGSPSPLADPFGITLHQELEFLVEAGLSPAAALRAASCVPAHWHRVPDRGSIRPGLRADLVLLNSNPLTNISNTQDIAKVWINGIEYPNVTTSAAIRRRG